MEFSHDYSQTRSGVVTKTELKRLLDAANGEDVFIELPSGKLEHIVGVASQYLDRDLISTIQVFKRPAANPQVKQGD
jgi:hypothetical protein